MVRDADYVTWRQYCTQCRQITRSSQFKLPPHECSHCNEVFEKVTPEHPLWNDYVDKMYGGWSDNYREYLKSKNSNLLNSKKKTTLRERICKGLYNIFKEEKEKK